MLPRECLRGGQHSTGPTTDAGKRASRMNALKHGLLAKDVVITRGDYKEDEEEFAQLLEDLREQFTPVGVAEDLEQKIALCYWRKMRAVRYEHGAIRQRTGNMREREEVRHEQHLDAALQFGANLEGSAGSTGPCPTSLASGSSSSSQTSSRLPRTPRTTATSWQTSSRCRQ
jgi:hypothetical protein